MKNNGTRNKLRHTNKMQYFIFYRSSTRGDGMSHASQKLRTVGTLLLFKKKTNDVTDFFGVFFFIFFVSSFFVIDS